MSQSGAVPPAHSRRHRPEMNQNNANEPITAAARFGETEWEARDVSEMHAAAAAVTVENLTNYENKILFGPISHSLIDNESWKKLELVLHKWKKR